MVIGFVVIFHVFFQILLLDEVDVSFYIMNK